MWGDFIGRCAICLSLCAAHVGRDHLLLYPSAPVLLMTTFLLPRYISLRSNLELRCVLCRRLLEVALLLCPVLNRSVLGIHALELLLQLCCLFCLSEQCVKHDQVRDCVCGLRVDLDGLLKSGFGLRQAAEMQFRDGLCDERV
jgi:hypothetical protein